MKAKKRIIAFAVALAMAFAMAFSVFFIAHNSEHNCSGDDCQICAQINNCIRSLNNITPKPESMEALIPVAFALVLAIGAVVKLNNKKSLVDLNVKLSD